MNTPRVFQVTHSAVVMKVHRRFRQSFLRRASTSVNNFTGSGSRSRSIRKYSAGGNDSDFVCATGNDATFTYDVQLLPGGKVQKGVPQSALTTLHAERLRESLKGIATSVTSDLQNLVDQIEAKFDPPAVGDRVVVRLCGTVRDVHQTKLIAFGGETQKAVVYHYDTDEPQAEQVRVRRTLSQRVLRRTSSQVKSLPHLQTAVRELVRDGKHRWAKVVFEQSFGHTVFAVSLAGQYVAVGGANPTVYVYDLSQGGGTLAFSTPVKDVTLGVSLSRSGAALAITGASREVSVFDCSTGAHLFRRESSDRLRAVALSADGSYCVFGGFDCAVTRCSTHAGARCASIQLPDVCRAVSVDRDGCVLAAGCDDKTVRCWALGDDSGASFAVLRWVAKHDAKVWCVAVAPDGDKLVAGDYANVVRVYSTFNGLVLWEKTRWSGTGAPFTWGVAWSGDGQTLVIGHWDAYVYVVAVEDWCVLVCGLLPALSPRW